MAQFGHSANHNVYTGFLFKTCLRPEAKVIDRQEKKDPNGQFIGERIIALAEQSEKKEFALIRRVRVDY